MQKERKKEKVVKTKKEPKGGKENNKISIDLFGTEILERKASKFGTGAHVIIPREHIGKKIKIIIEEESPFDTKALGEKGTFDAKSSVKSKGGGKK